MSEQDTQKIEEEVLDQDTKEIMEELDLNEEDTAEVKGDESEEETTEDETPEEETEEEVEEETVSEDEDETPEVVEPQIEEERQVKNMPVAKHVADKKKWKQKISDLEDELAKRGEKKEEAPETADDLKKLADEYGVDEDFVTKLNKMILSKTKLPEETQKQLDSIARRDKEEKADETFNNAISALQEENPNEPINDYKEKIKELGHTEGHTKESAYELFFRHIKPTISVNKKSAESSKGRGDVKKTTTNYDDPNLDVDNLSDKEFDEYTEAQASKEKRLEIRK